MGRTSLFLYKLIAPLLGIVFGILLCLGALFRKALTANHMMDLSFTLLACGALIWIGVSFSRTTKEGGHIVSVALIAAVMVLLLGGVIYNPSLHSLPIDKVNISRGEISFSKPHPNAALITSLHRLKHKRIAKIQEMTDALPPCCKQSVERSLGELLVLDELVFNELEKHQATH